MQVTEAMKVIGAEPADVADQLRRLLACLANCESDEAAQRLEAHSVKALITAWTVKGPELDTLLARFDVLRQAAGVREELRGAPTCGVMIGAATVVWNSWDLHSYETPTSSNRIDDVEIARGVRCGQRIIEAGLESADVAGRVAARLRTPP